jgi:hypothetical protein
MAQSNTLNVDSRVGGGKERRETFSFCCGFVKKILIGGENDQQEETGENGGKAGHQQGGQAEGFGRIWKLRSDFVRVNMRYVHTYILFDFT